VKNGISEEGAVVFYSFKEPKDLNREERGIYSLDEGKKGKFGPEEASRRLSS